MARAVRPGRAERCALRGAADHQSPAGLREGLPRPRPGLYSARCARRRRARASRRWARARASPALLAACTGLPTAPAACCGQGSRSPARSTTSRLALEVAVIVTLARRLVATAADARSAERARPSRQGGGRGVRRCLALIMERCPAASAACSGAVSRSPAMSDALTPADTPEHRPRPQPRLRQLVLHRDAHPAARAARGDVRDLFVLPAGRRHRGFDGAARRAPRASSREWRADIDALYAGQPPAAAARAWRRRCATSLCASEDFLAVIDGMEMDAVDDIRAPDWATLDLYCDRVASAVGRLSVRVFGMERAGRHRARASSRPRAAAHQYSARPRRGRRDRAALSAARGAARGRHRQRPSRRPCCASPALGQVCDAVVDARARAFRARPIRSWRAARAARCARRASWRRSIASSSKA